MYKWDATFIDRMRRVSAGQVKGFLWPMDSMVHMFEWQRRRVVESAGKELSWVTDFTYSSDMARWFVQ